MHFCTKLKMKDEIEIYHQFFLKVKKEKEKNIKKKRRRKVKNKTSPEKKV